MAVLGQESYRVLVRVAVTWGSRTTYYSSTLFIYDPGVILRLHQRQTKGFYALQQITVATSELRHSGITSSASQAFSS